MLSFISELWSFMRIRKKYWLLPIILMLAVFGTLIVLAKGTAGGAFIYTLFLGLHPQRILGISAFYHDSAAALLEDGRIVAAAQEERFTRKKHDAGFPRHAIEYCLRESGGSLADVDNVVFYDRPFLKFERLLETYLAFVPHGFT